MPLLFILLLVLIGRALTLPGAGAGLTFYLAPDFSEITGRTLLSAVGQAFFSLSLGMGAMITYGSYLRDKDEIAGNGAAVVGLDTLIAVMGGFAVFPAVFALGYDPAAGPGLTFITLPAVFAEMSGGVFFGFLFFTLLAIAALTSAISLLEVVVAWLVDQHRWPRVRAAVVLGVVIFLVGLPATLGYNVLSGVTFLGMDLLDTYDFISGNIMLPLGGLLTAIFVGYVWGTKNAQAEANKVAGAFRIGDWWGFLIRYVVPVAIAAIMFFGIYDTIKSFLAG
jgi:NSS family neurotransmitter:Na+ symporter